MTLRYLSAAAENVTQEGIAAALELALDEALAAADLPDFDRRLARLEN
ncbi:MAG: hypothetical protein L0332_18725 [Chloroflexi bacterium]|nr:hypothetical protein [Chloroflexota bacterium]MCI0579963.1 hypothetical protein [Chloroflexota bacterium]MCI0647505.1 hypothetical protein [Chloroflexota bacterium]MCI0728732.1 hypothetical protein [Chloroflexota bacterium]